MYKLENYEKTIVSEFLTKYPSVLSISRKIMEYYSKTKSKNIETDFLNDIFFEMYYNNPKILSEMKLQYKGVSSQDIMRLLKSAFFKAYDFPVLEIFIDSL